MKQAKHWIRVWFSIIISLILGIGIINYIVDPNGFNRMVEIPKFNKIKAQGSDSMPIQYKMPQLRKGGWDNLMMGTSSIGVMDNNVVSKHLGGRTFNLSQPSSAMPIQLDSFRYAVHYNDIKNVVYAVDFMSFNQNRKLNDDYIQLKDKLRNFDSFYSYSIYFNMNTLMKSLKLIWDNYRGSITPSARYLENGQRVYQNYIDRYEKGEFDLQKNMKEVGNYLLGENGYYENYVFSDEYMQQFIQMVKYCKENNINLYVYISPLYKDFLIDLEKVGLYDEFEYFKKELALNTSFIDFTQNNEMVNNINLFWDPLHLRVENTDMIMNDIFMKSPKDLQYGIYIEKNNIK